MYVVIQLIVRAVARPSPPYQISYLVPKYYLTVCFGIEIG